MKSWLDAVGRALIEFVLILALIALLGGLDSSLGPGPRASLTILRSSVRSAVEFMPLAIVVTLFFSMFAFDRRVRSRLSGWLGLLTVGSLLFAGYFGALQLPLAAGIGGKPQTGSAASGLPPRPGLAVERGSRLLWVRAYESSRAIDIVSANFDQAYPRLSYAGSAVYDPSGGTVSLGSGQWFASPPPATIGPLVPEAARLPDDWIWKRLPSAERASLPLAIAIAGGFLLLVLGFRFFARLSGWPLASAFLAAAGFVAALIADSFLASPPAARLAISLLGGGQARDFLIPAFEGALGLCLAAIDLLLAPGRRVSQ